MMTLLEIKMYDVMVENGIATEEELDLVKKIAGGPWETVINEICYVRTGYQNLNDWLRTKCEEEE